MTPCNCSILIVDDNPEDRYILERMIKKNILPKSIDEAINGEEALTQLIKMDSDNQIIIFLDINMPIMNGFEFLEKILIKDFSSKRVKIAMCSTSQDYNEKKKALEHPLVVSYFEKMPSAKKIEDFILSLAD